MWKDKHLKVLVELRREEYDALLRWLNFLKNNILKVSSSEGYHQVNYLISKLEGKPENFQG